MINLLPYDIKKQTRAARTNVLLVRYIILLGSAAVFLALACITTYYLLGGDKTNDKTKEINTTISTPVSPSQTQSDTFKADLVIASGILAQQVAYSDILTGIGSSLPVGTLLDSLTLNDSSFGVPTNLKVYARSADSEPTLKAGLQKPPQFTGYKLLSITSDQSGPSGYPVTISFSLIISKGLN